MIPLHVFKAISGELRGSWNVSRGASQLFLEAATIHCIERSVRLLGGRLTYLRATEINKFQLQALPRRTFADNAQAARDSVYLETWHLFAFDLQHIDHVVHLPARSAWLPRGKNHCRSW